MEEQKKIFFVIELKPKHMEIKLEDIIKKINIHPLFGGAFNQNLNLEIGLELPEEVEYVRRKIKMIRYNEDGMMEVSKDYE